MFTSKFPESGSFAQQQSFVKDLPTAEEHTILDQTVLKIERQANPASTTPQQIPQGVKVETYHHAISENSGSESKEKGKSVTAIITRRLNIDPLSKTESMVIRAPGNSQLTTTSIEFSPKGTPRVFQRNESLSEHTKELLLEDGKKQAGYIVKAEDTATGEARFTAFKRS